MADEIIIETTSQEVIEVGVPGPQGPAGAAGTGLEALTTKGDTLFRGETTGERLGIGSVGQVMKVSSGGVPHWANESGAVTSVNGQTGAVVLRQQQVEPLVYEIAVFEPNMDDYVPSSIPVLVVLSVSENDCDITLTFPTPSANKAGVSITIKAEQSPLVQESPASVFYTAVHNNATLLAGRELDIAEGADTWVWDGYKWRLQPVHVSTNNNFTRVYPNHGGTFAVLTQAPQSANSAGSVGAIAASPRFFYFCHSPNQWIRIPLAAWT